MKRVLKRVLKWVGIVLGGLVGLILLAILSIYAITQFRMNRTWTIQPETVRVPTDAAAIAYGQHLYTIRSCVDCHSENRAGGMFIDDPMLGRLAAANLTHGEGGLPDDYADEDYVRAIRHGVGYDSKPLLIMPSHEFTNLSNSDLGALIAYLKSAEPVDSDYPAPQVSLLIRAIYLFTDGLALLPVERIDHDATRPEVEPGVTVEYGAYQAETCVGCHGEGLSGGPTLPLPPAPGEKIPMNLTPGGELIGWTEEDFMTAMRTGVTPTGRQLDPEYMPWPNFTEMTDVELQALWLYLQSIPAREYGNR